MTQTDKNKEAWEQIPNSEQFLELYGYYPTLHDAFTVNFELDFKNREITIAFEYTDLIEKTENKSSKDEMSTKIVMRWTKILDAVLNQSYEGNVCHLELEKTENSFRTVFEGYLSLNGEIISKEIEIVSVEIL